jgi:hypothetical protein
LRAKSALFWEIRGYHTHVFPGTGALFVMQDNGWDHALKVTADGAGLVGHAGAVLLRKAADQAGLTAWLGGALRRAGSSPVFDRGAVLVSVASAIALGATSMSDIAVLAHLAPVLGAAPSGPTVRRALDLAGTAVSLERIGRARAKARAHVWQLIEGTPAGFPWLVIAGKTLAGWLVIDMDATLITACSDKEGAAPTWKKGYVRHEAPLSPGRGEGTLPPVCRSRLVKLRAADPRRRAGRWQAALTTTGRAGTARRCGSGKRDETPYERNQCLKPRNSSTGSKSGGSGPGCSTRPCV